MSQDFFSKELQSETVDIFFAFKSQKRSSSERNYEPFKATWDRVDKLCQKPNVNNRKINEQSLRDPRVYNKISNLHFIGIPEGKEKEDRAEEILEEIMAENPSHLAKDRNQI